MVKQIVWHESRGDTKAHGDCDDTGIEDIKHCKAFGITQYHKQTFYHHARLAKLHHAEWASSEDQLYLLRWALETGRGREWAGYKALFCY